ncbi:WD repeats-containing protein [Cryptosporidium ubiquitum]|uniref:WD repeats-containing protein n=1 Tax=Cryptosporidium ubiquitum TaxID=857276 RepID=A0A1J4MH18_9CRYT|nr:WD repeats-containing protein [Cryptosporidium ubiquitum]OII72141.1 WD repeats-containing protein [Cryptosporidium ubiquitum]
MELNNADLTNSSRVYELTGINGECLGVCFTNDGNSILVCGNDPRILLFQNYESSKNAITIQGHNKAVLEVSLNKQHGLQFSSCSADKTVRYWDIETMECISKFKGHTKIVNSCKCNNTLVISGSDDGQVCIWDTRINPNRACIYKYENKYPITAVSCEGEWGRIFAGGIDNNIYMIDMRISIANTFSTLNDTITGLDISPDNSSLVSNSMDSQVVIWDIRPHSDLQDRKVGTLIGAKHNFEMNLHRARWSFDGDLLAAASSDTMIYIWSVKHKKLINKLVGHKGATIDISFHPSLPIIASAGSDGRVIVGEFI